MEDTELEDFYNKLKKSCLGNVLNRVTEECIDDDKDEVDIVKLKKELNSFRQRDVDEPGTKKKTEGKLTFYLLVRKLESFAAEHLRRYVMKIDEDVISRSEFSKAVKALDIDTSLPNMAPDLPTKVVTVKEKDETGKDAIQLTTGDSIKKRYQSTLVLKTAKDGTLYEARSRICYKLTTDNHYVAVGKFDSDFKKQKLSKEDIIQIQTDGYPYLDEHGKEISGTTSNKKEVDEEEEEEDVKIEENNKSKKKDKKKKEVLDEDEEEVVEEKSTKKDKKKVLDEEEEEEKPTKKKEKKKDKKKTTDDEEVEEKSTKKKKEKNTKSKKTSDEDEEEEKAKTKSKKKKNKKVKEDDD